MKIITILTIIGLLLTTIPMVNADNGTSQTNNTCDFPIIPDNLDHVNRFIYMTEDYATCAANQFIGYNCGSPRITDPIGYVGWTLCVVLSAIQ